VAKALAYFAGSSTTWKMFNKMVTCRQQPVSRVEVTEDDLNVVAFHSLQQKVAVIIAGVNAT
jgi:hypothetical protein